MDRSCGPFSKYNSNGKHHFDDGKLNLSDSICYEDELRQNFQRKHEQHEHKNWDLSPTSYKEEEGNPAITTLSLPSQSRSSDTLDLRLKVDDGGFSNLNYNPRSDARSGAYVSSGRGIVRPPPPPAKGWSTNGLPSEGSGASSEVGAEESNSGASDGVAPGTKAAGDEVGAGLEANFLSVPVDPWTCHQCRQRKTGDTADCKGSNKRGKCSLRYCKNCIRNRYPLIAEEVLKKEAWECPKCRNDCNCSRCRKRKGEAPTGRMVCASKRPKVNLVQTESNDALKDEIVVPRGTLVTCIAGIKLQSEDVGAAIQFLEFCRSFGQVCRITEGQPEETLSDLTQLEEVSSAVADLHIKLLSVIEDGKDKPFEYPRHGDEWIKKVGQYITLTLHTEHFTLSCLNQGVSGYRYLNPSCKLEVLNCLCDEALSSQKLRTCIDIKDRECVATQKIKAATRKQNELKRRYEMAKVMEGGDTASNEEADNILSQIKEAEEVKQAAWNELGVLKRVHRTTPVMEDKGVKYWKLGGYCNNNINIMRQEFDEENRTKNKDMWFMFTEDEHKVVEDHVTTRSRRLRRNHNWA
ncbi:uncharacterized protein LOC123403953 isoform X1 [Hordeum vulgare subsp. vulgare]|uniref:uncharacterized protein LOC123403953 isoform X1 n=1 Tax=Hordeum vulgare subsp. vulgare TaxID=112509 RepID=UPI000B46CF03|nr:uncharacterized protein LOC123403953 isoform X1 [Hordeum vulgare subsp. vulgare]